MLLHAGNSWTKIVSANDDEMQLCISLLSYKTAAFKGKVQYKSLLQLDLFPAGLTRKLVRAVRERGFAVEIVHRGKKDLIADGNSVDGISWVPREHQKIALDIIREHQRGLIQHCTGGGKGDLIGLLAALITGRVLIIAPSKKLQEDLYGRCKKFGVEAGRLGSGYSETSKRVVVAVDDSLKRLSKKDLESFDALMCDECHQAAAKTYYGPLMKCKNAQIRLGFSATALDRADKKGLFVVGALGETIHRYTPDQAAKDGVISTARLRMVRFWHSTLFNTEDYVDWDKQAIAEHTNRNLLLLRLVHSTDAPRIVFTRTKQHQAVLVEMIGSADCAFVNDQTPLPEMSRIIDRLRSGEVKTLISTPIFRQGVDIPELKTVINGAGGKATIDVIQKVGRGSRILQADGSRKETFDVYDINDLGCGCQGEIHKGCKWLHTHSSDRKAAYEKYGYKVEDYSL